LLNPIPPGHQRGDLALRIVVTLEGLVDPVGGPLQFNQGALKLKHRGPMVLRLLDRFDLAVLYANGIGLTLRRPRRRHGSPRNIDRRRAVLDRHRRRLEDAATHRR
jgi:hypothetical protein